MAGFETLRKYFWLLPIVRKRFGQPSKVRFKYQTGKFNAAADCEFRNGLRQTYLSKLVVLFNKPSPAHNAGLCFFELMKPLLFFLISALCFKTVQADDHFILAEDDASNANYKDGWKTEGDGSGFAEWVFQAVHADADS